jgi:abortive infection bacteriophage resistance protein
MLNKFILNQLKFLRNIELFELIVKYSYILNSKKYSGDLAFGYSENFEDHPPRVYGNYESKKKNYEFN